MTDALLLAAAIAAIVVLFALAPIDELGFLPQFFGAGTAFGTLVAYRATRRNPRRETFSIQVRWGCVGLFWGLCCAHSGLAGLVIAMVRLRLAAIVILAGGAFVAAFDEWLGPWGQFAAGIATMFAVSAVLPHYMYRGEPLLPDRHRRRH